MRRGTNNMLFQLIGVGVVGYVMVTYWHTGQKLVRSYQTALGTMQLNTVASQVDMSGEGTFADDAPSDGAFPFPVDYGAFCALLRKEFPGRGDRAAKDRWGTDLWYWPYMYEGKPGYYLGSAGADRVWKTKDDLWICRWGEKRWDPTEEKKKSQRG